MRARVLTLLLLAFAGLRHAGRRPRDDGGPHGPHRLGLLAQLLARRLTARLRVEPQRPAAGVDGAGGGGLARGRDRARRPGRLRRVVARRVAARLHARPGWRNERAGLPGPTRRSGLRRLTAGGKETNRLAGFTHDGRELVLAGNARDGSAIDAYLVGVGGRTSRGATRSGGINGYTDISRDGTRAVLRASSAGATTTCSSSSSRRARRRCSRPTRGRAASAAVSSRPTAAASTSPPTRAATWRRSPGSTSTRRAGPVRSRWSRRATTPSCSGLAVDDAGVTAALLWNVAGQERTRLRRPGQRPVHVRARAARRRSPSAWPSPATAASSRSPSPAQPRRLTSGSSTARRASCARSRAARMPASTSPLWCGRAWCASRPTTASNSRAGSTARPAAAPPARLC